MPKQKKNLKKCYFFHTKNQLPLPAKSIKPMQRIRVTKEFDFEMAHALDFHDGKCHNIHGHSYQLAVTFIGMPANEPTLPKDGMVIDFSDLKRIVKQNIIDFFDHALVLRDNSRFLKAIDQELNQRLLLVDYQPTCENLILDFVDRIKKQIENSNMELFSVRLRETNTSFAEWYASDNL